MVYMIALIVQNKDIVGFVLLDYNTQKTANIQYNVLLNQLLNGKEVINLEVSGNKIKGKGGNLDRYTKYDIAGNMITDDTLVILGKISSRTYVISNSLGSIKTVQTGFIISSKSHLANAKLIRNGNSRYLSPISGNFVDLSHRRKINQKYIFDSEKILNKMRKLRMVGSKNIEHYEGLEIFTDEATSTQIIYVPENMEELPNDIAAKLKYNCKIIGPAKLKKLQLGFSKDDKIRINNTVISIEVYLDLSEVVSMESLCMLLDSLRYIVFSNPNTPKLQSLDSAFAGCSSLYYSSIERLDTRNVTNMNSLFFGCISLRDAAVRSTDKLKTITDMFYCCASLISVQLHEFNTSNVEVMNRTFKNCRSLKQLDLRTFDTSNVSRMAGMFEGCISLENINVTSFDTSKCDNMSKLFKDCSELKFIDLSNFRHKDKCSVTNMFEGCDSLRKVYMQRMDVNNSEFNSLGLCLNDSLEIVYISCETLGSLRVPNRDIIKSKGISLVPINTR